MGNVESVIQWAVDTGVWARKANIRTDGVDTREGLIAWIRLGAEIASPDTRLGAEILAEVAVIDALGEADRERVYDAAWRAFQG